MTTTLKRLILPTVLALGLILLAGCGKESNPVAPVPETPLSSLVVTPAVDTLRVGETTQFVVAALDTLGHPFTAAYHWKSTDTGVFTVSSAGLARGVGEGSALLVVSYGGRADTALVTVYPLGTGWVTQTSNASEQLNGVFFDPAGRRGWVVGNSGVVLSTQDAGATWIRSAPTTFNLRGVWFTSVQEGWAAGYAGTVLHTSDGGSSWRRVTSLATSENLLAVYFASPDTGWVVGGNGFTAHTFDRGVSWQKVYSGAGTALNAVMFGSDRRDGWAVGEGGRVVGTHDRGESWFVWSPSVTTQPLRGLWVRGVGQAWAVGGQGVAPRAVAFADSERWELRNAGGEYTLEGACFPAADVGFAVGSNAAGGVVLRTDNGGTSWAPQGAGSTFPLRAVFFLDPWRGWAVGVNGAIRHTVTGGS